MESTIETRADVTRFNSSHAVEIPNLLWSDSLTNFNNDWLLVRNENGTSLLVEVISKTTTVRIRIFISTVSASIRLFSQEDPRKPKKTQEDPINNSKIANVM